MNKCKKTNWPAFLLALVLVITGCGADKTEDKSATTDNSSTESTVDTGKETTDCSESETTTDSSEEPDESQITENEEMGYGLSEDDYYMDTPIVLDDGRLVFVKKAPNLQFYPDGEKLFGNCLESYEKYEKVSFTTALSMDADNNLSKATVTFEKDKNDHSFINLIKTSDFYANYEVGEPEIWDNGVTSYQMSMYGWEIKNYILYYPIDDNYSICISIYGFINDDGENFEEELEELFEFYRTEQEVFVVVGTASETTTDVTTETTTDVTTETTTESTVKPTKEPIKESARELYGLSENEYYLDTPIVLEDGRLVFVKKVPYLHYYPDGMESGIGIPCLDLYEGYDKKEFTVALSMDENRYISITKLEFEVDNNEYEFVDDLKNSIYYSDYEVGELETWENGITACPFSTDKFKNYILYYPLDDNYSIGITVWFFTNDLEEVLEEVLDFYHTEQDLFVVVDAE